MGDAEAGVLSQLEVDGKRIGQMESRGAKYEFDLTAMTQKNMATSKVRQIRRVGNSNSSSISSPSKATASAAKVSHAAEPAAVPQRSGCDGLRVEVWLAGDWKPLLPEESKAIADKQAAGKKKFEVTSRNCTYRIDLEQMTQTNLKTNRTRTIRLGTRATSSPEIGFDHFRDAFRKHAPDGHITEQLLLKSWPADDEQREELMQASVKAVLKQMDLRQNGKVDMVEWNHFWAMERDSPSFHAGNEVNLKLRQWLQRDDQVLGRMQMHFETAAGEEDGSGGGRLSIDGLKRACERLVQSPKPVLEKQWAKEVLQKNAEGEGFEEDEELSYYDFLNVMLGRKRFKVSLFLYDISHGVAAKWSWLLLGQHMPGVWHSGIVVEWPERSSEFWFGGSLFESKPGKTPFGEPLEKRALGYTYKFREEVWDHLQRSLATEFTKDRYDVLTHNCNHFSEKLSMFLRNDHIPDDVLHQPDMVMSKPLPILLRPLLNRWLAGFRSDDDGRATDGGEHHRRLWDKVLPGALVEFCTEEGGRPRVGEVTEASMSQCTICCLDLWSRTTLSHCIPAAQVMQVLCEAPVGAVRTQSVKTVRCNFPC